MFKISILTDIHLGALYNDDVQNSGLAERLITHWVKSVTDQAPDLVVDLGDRTDSPGRDAQIEQLTYLSKKFANIKQPFIHLVGNHDLDHLSNSDIEKVTGWNLSSQTLDILAYHLVFWNPLVSLEEGKPLRLIEQDLGWLKGALCNSRHPILLFSHFPLYFDHRFVEDHPYFQDHPYHVSYSPEDLCRIQQVLKNADKLLLCIHGHIHKEIPLTIDQGILYLTVPAFKHSPAHEPLYSQIVLNHNLEIGVYGLSFTQYSIPLEPTLQ